MVVPRCRAVTNLRGEFSLRDEWNVARKFHPHGGRELLLRPFGLREQFSFCKPDRFRYCAGQGRDSMEGAALNNDVLYISRDAFLDVVQGFCAKNSDRFSEIGCNEVYVT